MNREDAMKTGVFFGFIPRQLDIGGMPQFSKFPFNILFMKMKVEGGRQITGTALYEPEFHTFNKENYLSCMRYRNVYGGDNHVMIGYDDSGPSYCAKKFVNGEEVGMTEGSEWKMFFTHLTMLGISNGERCKFDEDGIEKSGAEDTASASE